jgi:FkbM family methyltransferase
MNYEIGLRGEYQEFETIEWLRSVVKPGDCILDIGANVGQMTLEAALLTGPHGKVVAIEPGPGNVRLLHAHVEANGFADRVDVVVAACGETSGEEVTLHVFGDDPHAVGSGHNTRAPAHAGHWLQINVPLISVDQLCQDASLRPAAIKIDVEGAEVDVIRGCQATLRAYRPSLRFGFHPFAFDDPAAATREIRSLLSACGYSSPSPGLGDAYELAEYDCYPIGDAAPHAAAVPAHAD